MVIPFFCYKVNHRKHYKISKLKNAKDLEQL